MDTAFRGIQIIRMAMLGSIVLYLVLVQMLPSAIKPNPIIFFVLTGVAVTMVMMAFFMRRILVVRHEATLASQPNDMKALNTWRSGYIVTYALCEAIAIYGLLLHLLGFSLSMVLPFLLAGFVLILYFAPRRPSNAIG